MKRDILYKYLGTNGNIISPVHLEDVYYIRLVKLMAENGKMLTKDNKTFHNIIIVPEEEEKLWREN